MAATWGRFASIGTTVLGAVLLLSGCGLLASPTPPPSGAFDPDVVAARELSDANQVALLQRVAGRDPLSVSRRDTCRTGQDNWKIHETYYWSCERAVSWVIPEETEDPAVFIAAWKARLVEVGCEPDEAGFDMMQSYWQMFGVPARDGTGDPYTVDDLTGGTAWCGTGYVGIGFSTPQTVDTSAIGAYLDGELITDEPHDATAIRSSTAPFVAVISTGDGYHTVSRVPTPTPAVEEDYCACYSGSRCDCPGG